MIGAAAEPRLRFEDIRVIILLLAMGMLLSENSVAQTSEICGNSPIPQGWVITGWGGVCDRIGNQTHYVRKIRNIANEPTGSEVGICGDSPIPPGWIIVSWGGICQRIANSTHHVRNLKRIDGLPVGTVEFICGNSPIPNGWIVKGSGSKRVCTKIANQTHFFRSIERIQ